MEKQSSLKERIRENYAREARRVIEGRNKAACCGTAQANYDAITSNLYADSETCSLPADAVAASLGCGNPTALAELKPGEIVLDLGSGGGIDVLLSARRVGPTGKAYGIDMIDEMLALALENMRKAGVSNADFLKGEIENIPLPDNSVDVVISNCVINISVDKDSVLREAFRVLKPGGRFAVSDIIVRGDMPLEIRGRADLWALCVSGALEERDYRSKLSKVGFEQIDMEPARIYTSADAKSLLAGNADVDGIAEKVDGKFMSAFVRATKPLTVAPRLSDETPRAASCCATSCCARSAT